MPTFAAIVVGPSGRKFSVEEEAPDVNALQAKLRARNLWPLRIEAAQTRGKMRTKIPVGEFVALLQQLELQLRAGVTADVALAELAADAPKGAMRRMLEAIHGEVAQGTPIHAACRKFERQFPPQVAAVIAAGEAAAQLPEALHALSGYLVASDELRKTARRALIYPAIVLLATSGLILFLLAGVVPKFAAIFVSMRLELPAITVVLLACSDLLRHHGVWLGGGLLGVGVLGWSAARSERVRQQLDALTLRIPVLGETIRCLATARFAAHCRLLHEAGIPLLEALETAADLVNHAALAAQLRVARKGLAEGKALYASLPAGHDFPGFLVPALKSGETTGQLGRALRQVEEYAARCARERLATALALLEPLLLAGLTALVGAIAFSFFLPLFTLLGGINSR